MHMPQHLSEHFSDDLHVSLGVAPAGQQDLQMHSRFSAWLQAAMVPCYARPLVMWKALAALPQRDLLSDKFQVLLLLQATLPRPSTFTSAACGMRKHPL